MQRSDPRPGADRRRGVPIKLFVGQELIDVWLDETGIHFRHPDGTTTEGHLPWTMAIAMSLVPPDHPREASIAV